MWVPSDKGAMSVENSSIEVLASPRFDGGFGPVVTRVAEPVPLPAGVFGCPPPRPPRSAPSSPPSVAVPGVIGSSETLRVAIDRAIKIAPHRTGVLVTGESGTGKELIARLLHDRGPWPEGPFVAVNCSTLSRELAESELFGHERGSFTGAANRRSGWFEEASGGTLVLDEIGELPIDLQPKLLRVLETGRLRRVGGRGETPVSVRVVALTLRDLWHESRLGRFRQDLYHRLSGCSIALPPLRARVDDIPLLAEYFLAEAATELGVNRRFAGSALARLSAHSWPGNVRELRNVVHSAARLCGEVIEGEDLGIEVGWSRPVVLGAAEPVGGESFSHTAQPTGQLRSQAPGTPPPGPPESTAGGGGGSAITGDFLYLRGRSFEEMQKEIFLWALRENGGSRRRAARALGISRSTFCDRVKRLGLAPLIG